MSVLLYYAYTKPAEKQYDLGNLDQLLVLLHRLVSWSNRKINAKILLISFSFFKKFKKGDTGFSITLSLWTNITASSSVLSFCFMYTCKMCVNACFAYAHVHMWVCTCAGGAESCLMCT